MDPNDVKNIVTAILKDRKLNGLQPHELLKSLNRKKLPGDCFSAIEPLLHSDSNVTYKTAIDILGKMKDPPDGVSEAVESTWERTWYHGVPQASVESFRALIRIGGNDDRLLAMITKAMKVDNYGVHKECAEALMKISNGRDLLSGWSKTIAGKCDCYRHQKLSEKIQSFLNSK